MATAGVDMATAGVDMARTGVDMATTVWTWLQQVWTWLQQVRTWLQQVRTWLQQVWTWLKQVWTWLQRVWTSPQHRTLYAPDDAAVVEGVAAVQVRAHRRVGRCVMLRHHGGTRTQLARRVAAFFHRLGSARPLSP
eukprot:2296497-Pyramimonas_sp.AAC.1